MHEVSIAQEIIEIVIGYLPKNNHVSVKSVKVEIGEFSNILPEALCFGFKVLTDITNMKGAELIISKIPLTVKCRNCGNISTLDEPFFFCNACDCANVDILTGTEMRVIEIELND